jgi:hypothetical protein
MSFADALTTGRMIPSETISRQQWCRPSDSNNTDIPSIQSIISVLHAEFM